MIRSRIEKERIISNQRNVIESGIFETDGLNNMDQLKKENDEEENKEKSESKGQYLSTTQKVIIQGVEVEENEDRNDLKDTKDKHNLNNSDKIHVENQNIPKKDLEKEFYSLLDELITDLNPTENGISTLDGISKQQTPERRSETEMKFTLSKEAHFITNPEDEQVSTYSGCSHNAGTQTEKKKKVKKCHIM